MLTVTGTPATYCPNTKSRPVRWKVSTDDHVINAGAFAQFTLNITGTGAANGETVILNGVTFTVDNSTPFTNTTFQADGTVEETANNIADAMRSNYLFAAFQIYVTGSGSDYTINCLAYLPGVQTPWTFDTSGLTSIPNVITDLGAGLDIELANYRLWYRVYENDNPISEERRAELPFDANGFPYYGETIIDVTKLVRGILRTTTPSYVIAVPFQDISYMRRVHIRFGSIEGQTDCTDPIRGQMYQTGEVEVTNSVFQMHNEALFLNYCPNGANPVKFLTDRPRSAKICASVHEWVHIYVNTNFQWLGGFKVRYTFYTSTDATGFVLSTKDFSIEAGYVYRVDLGPSNAAILANTPLFTGSYTVQVVANKEDPGDPGEVIEGEYSEIITRIPGGCNCKTAEVYFIEDTGSWRTVVFNSIEERREEVVPLEYTRRIDWESEDGYSDNKILYVEGGRYSQAAIADSVFVLETERITEYNRTLYQQLLRSPTTLIKTVNELGESRIRRVIFDRQAERVLQKGSPNKLQLSFRFNVSTRVH